MMSSLNQLSKMGMWDTRTSLLKTKIIKIRLLSSGGGGGWLDRWSGHSVRIKFLWAPREKFLCLKLSILKWRTKLKIRWVEKHQRLKLGVCRKPCCSRTTISTQRAGTQPSAARAEISLLWSQVRPLSVACPTRTDSCWLRLWPETPD